MTSANSLLEARASRDPSALRLLVCAAIARVTGIAVLVMLAACGGGGAAVPTAPANPPRGTLLENPPHLSYTLPVASLLQQLSIAANQGLLTLGGTPLCDISVFHLRYASVGGAGEYATASGALLVPSGLDSRCRGSRPIVEYAHGTSTDRAYNIAASGNAEALYLAAFFAAQGSIVVAPNYAGYDTSSLPYHPYLNGDQQSKDMIDALTAARHALATVPVVSDDGRLYITGYSQGGYVALATERAMQAAGMTVTAAGPMSGPYSLAAFVDAEFAGQVSADAPVVATYLITAYQKSYGNVYASPGDVFEAEYASGVEMLLPTLTPRATLYAQGLLPEYAMFSLTPPAPAFADLTPPTTPAALAPLFALGFGDHNLILNSYRLSYLLDVEAHPDGGWPLPSTGVAAAAPDLPLRQSLARNDLRTYTPGPPTLLCGGNADPTVYWLNTRLLQQAWKARADVPAAATVLDLDSPVVSGEPYGSLKSDFALARSLIAAAAVLQGATDGGASAVAAAYHSALVPPFCLAAVREFFLSN